MKKFFLKKVGPFLGFAVPLIVVATNPDPHITSTVGVIHSLSANSFRNLVNKNILPSAITKASVLAEIRKREEFNWIPDFENRTIVEGNISLEPSDTAGVLVIKITGHGPVKTVTLNGFQTTDETAVNSFVSGLDNTSAKLGGLVNNKALPNTITEANVLAAIKTATGYDELSTAQKALLVASDIGLVATNGNGRLVITISNHGPVKIVTLNGFQTTQEKADEMVVIGLQHEVDKFNDSNSEIVINELDASLKTLTTDGDGNAVNVKTAFIGVQGYQVPDLTAGVTLTKVVVKTALDAQNKVVYTVTVEKDGSEADKDITVTYKAFSLQVEADRFNNFNSGIAVNELDASLKTLTTDGDGNAVNVKTAFTGVQGYQVPDLTAGVTLTKVVVKTALNAQNKVVYTVTVEKDGSEAHEDITVTYATKWEVELAKIKDFESTSDVSSKQATLAKDDANVKTQFEAIVGLPDWSLASGVSVTKVVVNEALDTTSRQVKFTITLTKVGDSDPTQNAVKTKDVTVTFAPDLDAEALKFKDFDSGDSNKSDGALLKTADGDVKDTFTAIAGYTAPELIEGVTVSKVAIKEELSVANKVVFILTLSYGENTKTTDVTVTFKAPVVAASTGLSNGQVAGIIIGSIVGAGALGYLIYYLLKRRS